MKSLASYMGMHSMFLSQNMRLLHKSHEAI
jgi:hypothetical protein